MPTPSATLRGIQMPALRMPGPIGRALDSSKDDKRTVPRILPIMKPKYIFWGILTCKTYMERVGTKLLKRWNNNTLIMVLPQRRTWQWIHGTSLGIVGSMTQRSPLRWLNVDALESYIWGLLMTNWLVKSFHLLTIWENGKLYQKMLRMRIKRHILIAQFTHLLAKTRGQDRRNSVGVKSNHKTFHISVLTMMVTANAKVMSFTWPNKVAIRL